MCLSSVYTEKVDEDSIVVREASQVHHDGRGKIEISTLFGEKKVLQGYFIREINLLKNFVVLNRR
jgi:predicted RNA-binding protein